MVAEAVYESHAGFELSFGGFPGFGVEFRSVCGVQPAFFGFGGVHWLAAMC